MTDRDWSRNKCRYNLHVLDARRIPHSAVYFDLWHQLMMGTHAYTASVACNRCRSSRRNDDACIVLTLLFVLDYCELIQTRMINYACE